jgi:hypothetical protein
MKSPRYTTWLVAHPSLKGFAYLAVQSDAERIAQALALLVEAEENGLKP